MIRRAASRISRPKAPAPRPRPMAGPEVAADPEVAANSEAATEPSPAAEPSPAGELSPFRKPPPPQSPPACPAEPPSQPRLVVDPDVELVKLRYTTRLHVQRHNEARGLYGYLIDEFNELRKVAGQVLCALQDPDYPHEELRVPVDWLMEQRPLIVENNEQLQGKVLELRESVPDVSAALVEMFHALERTCLDLSGQVEVLQRGLVVVYDEFVARTRPVELPFPGSESIIETPAAHSPAVDHEIPPAEPVPRRCRQPSSPTLKSPVETFVVQPPAYEEPPAESPVETPAVAPLAASPPLDPVLDPIALNPDLDPVVLNPVLDSPVLDSPVLDPVLDPAPSDVLSASSVDKPPDEISVGSAFDSAPVLCSGSPGSSVFGPATVQLASVKKPLDEISVDSAPSLPDPQLNLRFHPPDLLDAAPAREPPSPPESRTAGEDSAKGAEKQLHEPGIRQVHEEHAMLAPTSLQQPEPSSVPRCASQYPPVPLSAAQHLSAPVCPPTSLFGPPFCDYVARDDAHHRSRLRSSRRRLRHASCCCLPAPARNRPGGNSRRLPRLRQDSQKPPNKIFHCFGSFLARKLPTQSPASEKYSLAPASAPPVRPLVPRPTHHHRRRERLRQSPAPSYGRLPQSFRC
jgi:hypothetical protein